MYYLKKIVFFMIVCGFYHILIPSYGFTAPIVGNVDGVMTDGQKIFISGTNFGQHSNFNKNSDYLVRVWENLEAGNADSSILSASRGPELITDTSAQKKNSLSCAKGYYYSTNQTYTNVLGKNITTQTAYQVGHYTSAQKEVFISGWFMFPKGFSYGINYQKGDLDQSKFLMISPPDDQPKTYYSVTTSGTNSTWIRLNTEEGPLGYNLSSVENFVGEGNWTRFDIYADISQPHGKKIHKWWINGKLVRESYYNESSCDANPGGRGCLEDFSKFLWLGYFKKGSDEAQWPIYVDDMFLDFTQARVEISKNSKWDETRQIHKEIQIPTAWSSSSITIKVNQGSFQKGETAYLYVIDENGNVNSQGYPIKFGGTSTSSSSSSTSSSQPPPAPGKPFVVN